MTDPEPITPDEATFISRHFKSESIVKRLISDGLFVIQECNEVKKC